MENTVVKVVVLFTLYKDKIIAAMGVLIQLIKGLRSVRKFCLRNASV